MPWGKYKGEPLELIPSAYLCWVCEESSGTPEKLCNAAREILAERFADDVPTKPPPRAVPPFAGWLEQERAAALELVNVGFRTLLLRVHPDKHPDNPAAAHQATVLVNEVTKRLRRMLNGD